ncbi:MAG: hypothetical protein GWN30_21700, partial [Gammaproteobacteria bacterium]|nr:hypothetical protein [Gammaproteobacteria bacterium]NIW96787.1 hypothetical protein [Phycisphaerae bacterium]
NTLTLEADTSETFDVGGQMSIMNANDSNSITVNEGTGTTLYVLDTNGLTDSTGGVTIDPGGFAT